MTIRAELALRDRVASHTVTAARCRPPLIAASHRVTAVLPMDRSLPVVRVGAGSALSAAIGGRAKHPRLAR